MPRPEKTVVCHVFITENALTLKSACFGVPLKSACFGVRRDFAEANIQQMPRQG